eukprot:124138-Pelagomonas_calceolata.AAC.1
MARAHWCACPPLAVRLACKADSSLQHRKFSTRAGNIILLKAGKSDGKEHVPRLDLAAGMKFNKRMAFLVHSRVTTRVNPLRVKEPAGT